MTFTHEGNKTFVDNMVNFEKMVRLSNESRKRNDLMPGAFLLQESVSCFTLSASSPTQFGRCATVEANPSVSRSESDPFQPILSVLPHSLFPLFLLPDPDICQPNKNQAEVRGYVRKLCVIDNQRALTQLSYRLEPRRT